MNHTHLASARRRTLMNTIHLAYFFPMFVLAVSGCGADGMNDDEIDGDSEDVAETQGALAAGNTLAANTLAANTLAANTLAANTLAANTLAANTLAANALAVIQSDTTDGASGRQLVKYTVSCALEASQSFSFSWTDSANVVHNEVYPGLLGLAPSWASGPLTDETQQRLVSACLAARVNYYGVAVTLSLRSRLDPLRTSVQSDELDAYTKVEGAFWGNLFGSSPHINACYFAGNESVARAAQRDCAVGHLESGGGTSECGIIDILGPCSNWCTNFDTHERWYHDCTDPGSPGSPSTGAVIVTALP
jgi:hypothetical protein